jgi:hypothetical protein
MFSSVAYAGWIWGSPSFVSKVKRLESEADRSPQSNVEVKMRAELCARTHVLALLRSSFDISSYSVCGISFV